MFGFMEPAYSVLDNKTLTTSEGTQELELRQAASFRGQPSIPYISVEFKSKTGEVQGDRILQYQTQAAVDADWVRVCNEPEVRLKELAWSEMVVDHHVGYGKDGSVTMY